MYYFVALFVMAYIIKTYISNHYRDGNNGSFRLVETDDRFYAQFKQYPWISWVFLRLEAKTENYPIFPWATTTDYADAANFQNIIDAELFVSDVRLNIIRVRNEESAKQNRIAKGLFPKRTIRL